MNAPRFWDAAACAALQGLLANAKVQDLTSGNGTQLARIAGQFADCLALERGNRLEDAKAAVEGAEEVEKLRASLDR